MGGGYIPETAPGTQNDAIGGGNGGARGITNKPKLIISNYQLSPEMPKAGQEFKLHLTFTNTHSYKNVRNIKISLGGGEGLPVPSPPGAGGNQQAAPSGSSGSAFTPVGSSNTFYISRISPEDTDEKTITLKTAPTLAANNYSINVLFEYEDLDGNEYTATETIGIPVVQMADVLLGDVQIKSSDGAPMIAMGTTVNVDLDMYNIGKDTLSTYMVSIEGEGFELGGSPRHFVGNFSPGASEHFSVEITPKANDLKGNIVITYEDSTGQKHEKKQPFQMHVEGSEDMKEGQVDRSKLRLDEKTGLLIDDRTGQHYEPKTLEPAFPPEPSEFPIVPVAGGLVLVLIAALLIWRRHKKKGQEKELDLDA